MGRMQRSREEAIPEKGALLERVHTFKYLRRILSENDKDWPGVGGNLRKEWSSWAKVGGVLSQEGATPQVSIFYIRKLCSQKCCSGQKRGWSQG